MKKIQTNIVKFIMAAVFLAVVPGIALADQAEVLTKAQAAAAVALFGRLKADNRTQIQHFCKPCDDTAGKVETVNKVEMKGSGDKWSVYINGKIVDLAYIYFPLEPQHREKKNGKNWKNVAMHLSISVDGVDLYKN